MRHLDGMRRFTIPISLVIPNPAAGMMETFLA